MADEKFDEKEAEKQEEKSWEEKYRNDPVSAAVWACVFIWAGLVLLAGNLGLLDWLSKDPGQSFFAWNDTWGLILLGAGVIVLFGAGIRMLVPAYRRSVSGDLILGAILMGIGVGNIFGFSVTLPLILIVIGLSILLRGWRRERT
jgi:low affinity Fe/Cu permease